jgi:hypothetical protein
LNAIAFISDKPLAVVPLALALLFALVGGLAALLAAIALPAMQLRVLHRAAARLTLHDSLLRKSIQHDARWGESTHGA